MEKQDLIFLGMEALELGSESSKEYTDASTQALAKLILGSLSGSSTIQKRTIVIPASGWVQLKEGVYYLDIEVLGVSETSVVKLHTADEESAMAYAICNFSGQCDAMDGKIRFYAETAPKKAIKAVMLIF